MEVRGFRHRLVKINHQRAPSEPGGPEGSQILEDGLYSRRGSPAGYRFRIDVLYMFSMNAGATLGELFVYPFKPQLSRRVIPLAYLVFLLACAFLFPLKLGFERFFVAELGRDGTLCFTIGIVAMIALGLRAAFPPPSRQPKLEVSKHRIAFVPGPIARRIFLEPVVEAEILPEAHEILVCRRYLDELCEGDSVIVRVADGTEREVKAYFMRLDGLEPTKLLDGIAAATGLPVQFVVRRRSSADGSIRETKREFPSKASTTYRAGLIVIVALPYLGGSIVGYLLPSGGVIVAVGLTLWLCQSLALYLAARKQRSGDRPAAFTALRFLTTLFTFGAAYGAIVAIVSFTVHSR